MSQILSMQKLTSFTLPEVIQPIISKNPSQYITTFKKERVSEGDVSFMLRNNDDRLSENINQYARSVNVASNLNFQNMNFLGDAASQRLQTKLPGSYLPGSSQHRLEFIPEKYISLSRANWRWHTEICAPNPAKPIKTEIIQHPEYKLKKTVTINPQASKKTYFPCCGNARDAINQDNYYDLMQYIGFLIQDPLVSEVTSAVKGNQINGDIDFKGIENKMKELLYLENVQSNPIKVAFIEFDENTGKHNINVRKVTDKELNNLNIISNKSDKLSNVDVERAFNINMKDKQVLNIKTTPTDTIIFIAPTPIIPELEKLIPAHKIVSNMSDKTINFNESSRKVNIQDDVKPRLTVNNIETRRQYQTQDQFEERGYNSNSHQSFKGKVNTNETMNKQHSEGLIPSAYRAGRIPNLQSKKTNPIYNQ